ncbi:hypothetical protein ACFXA3_00400 [Streptomyces sp. NPDC059456]|uniref:hypothetical protein n=1 Tax=Streptomyces sp. NPDC059456 TaxID=3346838 RepID=UPI00369EFC05
MTADLPPLWPDGWATEPCGDGPRAVETRSGHGLDEPDDQPRIIPGDHGQPPGRRRELDPRVIYNLPTGDLL